MSGEQNTLRHREYRDLLERNFQRERAAVLSAAVGRARLALNHNNVSRAMVILDEAAAATSDLVDNYLNAFQTPLDVPTDPKETP